MKIIFLDVDGVLNTPKLLKKFGLDFIDDVAVALVAWIVKETGAKIVLSSTWRVDNKNKRMVEQALAYRNLEIHDSTPIIYRSGWESAGGVERREEIQAWLNNNQVEKFAIIDDCNEASIEGSFFKTNEKIGLTVSIAEKIIEHLGKV
jgi:hypothetical protein